jgi:hypothetical protein
VCQTNVYTTYCSYLFVSIHIFSNLIRLHKMDWLINACNAPAISVSFIVSVFILLHMSQSFLFPVFLCSCRLSLTAISQPQNSQLFLRKRSHSMAVTWQVFAHRDENFPGPTGKRRVSRTGFRYRSPSTIFSTNTENLNT